MVYDSSQERVAAVMQHINQAWLDGRVDDMAPFVHPDIVMVLPGFSGQTRGRDEFLAGFHDFTDNAAIHEFQESDHQVDVIGDTAVIHFKYDMVYEMSGQRYRATGRDLWVFHQQDGEWLAVWRAMLDTGEIAI